MFTLAGAIRTGAMSRIAILGLIAAIFAAAGPMIDLARADPGKRVALVIGNGDYQFAPKLDNPSLDARAVAAALRRIGFQVTEGYDLPIADMRAKLAKFSESLPGSSAALIYYAGHGVFVDDENYLLPVDIRLKTPTDLDLNAMSLSLVLRQMHRDERVNIVILDACRDNPFAAEMSRAKSRAVVGERGLSRIEGDLARGALIAFASDPKSVALDGPPGQHSPFTKALLSHIEDPDVAIDTAMSRVRADVWNETKNKQLPWVNTSIIGEFDLNPTARPPVRTDVAAASPPAPDREAREDLLWESAQHSDLASDYRVYLEAYPSGVFAQMARNRIAALEPGAPAPVSRTSPPPGSGIPSLKDEAADEAAERALGLDPAARKEIQLRLTLLGFPAGVADGEFAEATRAAIREWQRSHGLDPSGWLGPLQYAELKSESESEYHHQRFVRTQAAPPPAPAIDAEPPAASPPQAALPPVSPPPAPAIEAQPPLAPLPTAPAVKAKPPTPPRRASLPPAPAIPAKPPEAPRVRKPIAETKRHPTDAAPVEPAPRAPTPPPPASAEIGPCVPGFHTVSSPTHLGYRCVQDGY